MKLYKSRFDTAIRGNSFFSQRIVDNWNNLSSDVMESNSVMQKPIRYVHARSRVYASASTLFSLRINIMVK